MIYYDWQSEGWIDTENDEFFIDMTPESIEGPDQKFDTQEEFYEWYHSHLED